MVRRPSYIGRLSIQGSACVGETIVVAEIMSTHTSEAIDQLEESDWCLVKVDFLAM